MSNQCHLGDGVYAEFDGYGVLLETNHEHPSDKVYLEPEALARLNEKMAAWQEGEITHLKQKVKELEEQAVEDRRQQDEIIRRLTDARDAVATERDGWKRDYADVEAALSRSMEREKAAISRADKLRTALAGLVDADTPEELAAMVKIVEAVAVIDKSQAPTAAAVRALLEDVP